MNKIWRRIYVIAGLMLFSQSALLAALQQAPNSERGFDVFEQIALQKNVQVPGLEPNRVVELSYLEWMLWQVKGLLLQLSYQLRNSLKLN